MELFDILADDPGNVQIAKVAVMGPAQGIVIDKALSPAIENRYASAAEWLADLRPE